jgi:hypothetical protein
VKKLVAIGLLFSFLSSTTEFHEFFKIPHLVQHYVEHGLETGLVNFIQMHYTQDNAHKKSHDEHDDQGCLPFQGTHATINISLAALNITGVSIFNLKPLVSCSDNYFPYSEFAISRYHANIWQPPKIG